MPRVLFIDLFRNFYDQHGIYSLSAAMKAHNIEVDFNITEVDAKAVALSSGKVQKWMDGKEPKKIIYIKKFCKLYI